jgi:co-chaperonin GroES (HSP10)
MKAYKILLKVNKEENKWDYEAKGAVQIGEVAFPYKNDDVDLKKGDIVYFQDDYSHKLNIDGKEFISTNPTNLICLK